MNSLFLLAIFVPALLATPSTNSSKHRIDLSDPFHFPAYFKTEEDCKKYIPLEIFEFTDSLTSQEMKDFDKIGDLIKGGHIVTAEKLPDVIRDASPSAYKKYEKMMSVLKEKVHRLSKPTQEFINKLIHDVSSLAVDIQTIVKADPRLKNVDENLAKKTILKSTELFRRIINFLEKNPEGLKEIVEQWPEVGRIMKIYPYKFARILAKIDPSIDAELVDLEFEMIKEQAKLREKQLEQQKFWAEQEALDSNSN